MLRGLLCRASSWTALDFDLLFSATAASAPAATDPGHSLCSKILHQVTELLLSVTVLPVSGHLLVAQATLPLGVGAMHFSEA